ncbi:MAG: type I polyketide synthase [Pseudomonadota bacterium]
MTDGQPPDHAALLKRSLQAIDQLQARLAATERTRREPIAIVGMGCRFPAGAEDPDSFWQLLLDGVDTVTEVPADRWDIERYYDADPDAVGKTYTRWGSFLDNIELFDAGFFGISRREALSLDPQQRLLLEVTWRALEHAGMAPASLMGTQSAVYLGMTTHDYSQRLANAGATHLADAYTPSGTAHSMAAGRLSYVLGLHGPNVAIDTACSSSLVAVHWAVQSLRNGEANLALAGGVNLTLIPDGSILTSRGRMMSFDGHCKTFDASADGYVRGEGCGMIVMKRLSDAQRDGDRILAVIRGSALNQDGRSSGLTAPNGPAQEAVIRAALANAGLQPADVGYIEAHGTGTSLGDPIELRALGEVFQNRPAEQPLMVGSVKTNIGHTEAAAGVAGVIKAVLALQHGTVPPHLHLRVPNPLMDWQRYPITVPTVVTPWTVPAGQLRRAGVSSFGFSGTNAHVVIEEAPAAATPVDIDEGPQLLTLSAETPAALQALAVNVAEHLSSPCAASLRALARTAMVGRSHFTERLAVVASNNQQARDALLAYNAGEMPAGVVRGRSSGGTIPEVVFLFTGQGCQYPGMALQLYGSQPVFRQWMDECAVLLRPHLQRDLLELLAPAAAGLLDDTRYTQPVLFAIEYSLAKLWMSWGVEPVAVMGHSVGEYVAACIAGVFSLGDGLRLIAERGRLMGALPLDGGMAAVFADEEQVRSAIAADSHVLAIAAVNGPANIVISGERTTLERVLARLQQAGIESQRLNVSHAFHSPSMEPMLAEFERVAATVQFRAPGIGLVSNVSGELAADEVCNAGYWRRHVREPVRFVDSLTTLKREGYRVLLEVGPSPILLGMAQRCPQTTGFLLASSLRKGRDDATVMLENLGQLYARGVKPDPVGLWGKDASRNRVPLPGYPFQRERYWQDIDNAAAPATLAATRSGHPLLGGATLSAEPVFQTQLGVPGQPWLADHRIADLTLFPAAGFLELALAAAREFRPGESCAIAALRIREALVLPDDVDVTLQVLITPDNIDADAAVKIYSRAPVVAATGGSEWQLHVSGRVQRGEAGEPARCDREAIEGRLQEQQDVDGYYQRLAEQGAQYGPAFRGIQSIRAGGREVLGRIVLPPHAGNSAAGMLLHPALLDSCFQLIGIVVANVSAAADETYIPVGIGSYQVWHGEATQCWCHVQLADAPQGAATLSSDLVLFDDEGEVIARVGAMELQRISRAALRRTAAGAAAGTADWAFEVQWHSRVTADSRSVLPQGNWLVLGEGGEFGRAVVERLAQSASRVMQAVRGDHFDASAARWQIDPTDGAQLRSLLAAAAAQGPLAGVVSLWALETADGSRLDPGSLAADHAQVLGPTLALAQAISALQGRDEIASRLWLVTRGAQSVSGSVADLVQAPVWGLGGVIASELPAWRPSRIDLDPASPATEAAGFVDALGEDPEENRIALRGGGRLVARLTRAVLQPSPEESALRLTIPERGSLANLRLQAVEREIPGPGQVEIRVLATGLNFRDVLNALGMYPGDAGALGNECAGVISAVGMGVTTLRVGDEVIAMVDRSFATWVIAPAVLTVRKPASLTFAQAATIPVTFLTAEYALRHLAGMKRGDRVLLHAVTGGVGMAAAQLARRAGAEVFGTAGSVAKRALAMSLGARHVGDSRSLSFAADLMRETGGEGVDIVLNSLAGEFIPESLKLLRRGGHFIEIGKTGIWDEQKVRELFPGISYHPLYLGEIAAANPEFVRNMLEDLLAGFAAGELTPLPHRLYPLDQAEDAFRFMGQGLHTGKVVITQRPSPRVRADATYLVTGGLGGLGLACARWLAERGATQLVLIGRSKPTDSARALLEELGSRGINVVVAHADVSDEQQTAALFRQVAATLPPLRGILHAAGVVDDGMLAEQSLTRFAGVMAPKVRGGWNLHVQSTALPLDFFVTFSSGAALLGSPGQSNYAAANSFLDALAELRRSQGRPALSVQWGSWSQVGMAASVDEQHRRRWAAMGLQMISPQDGVRMLEELMLGSSAAVVTALPLVVSRLPPTLGPFFSDIVQKRSPKTVERDIDIRAQLAASPFEAREEMLRQYIGGQVLKVLALGSGYQIDAQRSIMDMGLDSLMAMELRNRLQAALTIRISVADLLAGASVDGLVQTTLGDMAAASDTQFSSVDERQEVLL